MVPVGVPWRREIAARSSGGNCRDGVATIGRRGSKPPDRYWTAISETLTTPDVRGRAMLVRQWSGEFLCQITNNGRLRNRIPLPILIRFSLSNRSRFFSLVSSKARRSPRLHPRRAPNPISTKRSTHHGYKESLRETHTSIDPQRHREKTRATTAANCYVRSERHRRSGRHVSSCFIDCAAPNAVFRMRRSWRPPT